MVATNDDLLAELKNITRLLSAQGNTDLNAALLADTMKSAKQIKEDFFKT